MLNPVHLQTLTTVLRFGSFADAARQLGYTGSAVSQQMSALERQLKVTLFERDAHSVRPTPAAVEIVNRSAGALGALQGLADDIERITTGRLGRLRIGSFPTASEQLLPAGLTRLRRVSPRLDVHLDEDEPASLVPMLERREIDVALLYRYRGVASRWPRTIRLRPLLVEDLLLIRAHTEPCEPVELTSLLEATWISTREDTSGAATLRQLCRAAGFDPMVSYRSNNYAVIQGLVASGLGTALIPAMAYQPQRGLSAALLSGTPAAREVLVASAPSTPDELVDVFETAMRKSAETFARDRRGVRLLDR
ncbi:LysR family transcriptional regulator [Amycolatopsis sp. GM8]|uniref:LysR family transcriptional regulator n=1 Tax=Amycolatopsis sp. GM8 TaxID=2896530 RepID=UPI001F2EC797|nr:LysR family transcriptional regulator [Amycolatopsis sp. GM8]